METAIDPVCGMSVNIPTARHKLQLGGETRYFCSRRCLEKFSAEPERYAKKSSAPAPAAGTLYTCPMHPEIRQIGPGACPKCGMALEPVVASADGEPNPELVDMTRRFWIGLALSLPVLALGMMQRSPWMQFILSLPVVLWAGWPFLVRGWNSLVSRSLNMYTLISLGVAAAFTYSVVAFLAPGIFPAAFRDASGHVGLYFEAAAVIAVLVLLGEVLQLRARENTSSAIRALLKLAPQTATRVRADGDDEEI